MFVWLCVAGALEFEEEEQPQQPEQQQTQQQLEQQEVREQLVAAVVAAADAAQAEAAGSSPSSTADEDAVAASSSSSVAANVAASAGTSGSSSSAESGGEGSEEGGGTRVVFTALGSVAREVNCQNEMWMALVLSHAAVQALEPAQLAGTLSAGAGCLRWLGHRSKLLTSCLLKTHHCPFPSPLLASEPCPPAVIAPECVSRPTVWTAYSATEAVTAAVLELEDTRVALSALQVRRWALEGWVLVVTGSPVAACTAAAYPVLLSCLNASPTSCARSRKRRAAGNNPIPTLPLTTSLPPCSPMLPPHPTPPHPADPPLCGGPHRHRPAPVWPGGGLGLGRLLGADHDRLLPGRR